MEPFDGSNGSTGTIGIDFSGSNGSTGTVGIDFPVPTVPLEPLESTFLVPMVPLEPLEPVEKTSTKTFTSNASPGNSNTFTLMLILCTLFQRFMFQEKCLATADQFRPKKLRIWLKVLEPRLGRLNFFYKLVEFLINFWEILLFPARLVYYRKQILFSIRSFLFAVVSEIITVSFFLQKRWK